MIKKITRAICYSGIAFTSIVILSGFIFLARGTMTEDRADLFFDHHIILSVFVLLLVLNQE